MWVRGRHIRRSWKRAPCTKDAQLGFSIKQSFTLESFPFGMVLSLPKHIWETFREREWERKKGVKKYKNTYKNENRAHVICLSFWHCYLGQIYLWASRFFKEMWLGIFILGDKKKPISSFCEAGVVCVSEWIALYKMSECLCVCVW